MSRASVTGAHEPWAADRDWRAYTPLQRLQRRTARVLVAAQILSGIGIGFAATLGALAAEEVMGSESLAGVARTGLKLGAAVIAVPLAALAYRRGRRFALAIGWAIAALGGLALVYSVVRLEPVTLIVGMLMFGCASAVNLQTRYAAVDLARPARAGMTLSIVVWATSFGSVIGPNLVGPGAALAALLGLPELAGGFLIGAVSLGVATIIIHVFLRPDPALVAARFDAGPRTATPRSGQSLRVARRAMRGDPRLAFAVLTLVIAETVMSAVMTMTPVHMAHHDAGLTLIGLTISIHVLGMYGFSPLVGMVVDRIGATRTILLGQGTLLASAAVAGLGQSSMTSVTAGLLLLGLGWSLSIIAASTLISRSAHGRKKIAVQGFGDMSMNLGAAAIASAAGFLQQIIEFRGLNLVGAVMVLMLCVMYFGKYRSSMAGAEADAIRMAR